MTDQEKARELMKHFKGYVDNYNKQYYLPDEVESMIVKVMELRRCYPLHFQMEVCEDGATFSPEIDMKIQAIDALIEAGIFEWTTEEKDGITRTTGMLKIHVDKKEEDRINDFFVEQALQEKLAEGAILDYMANPPEDAK